jgi:hypothetical protein
VVRARAFEHLVKLQHRATISRALATLEDKDLRAGEVPIPDSTPLDWIGNINASFAIPKLKQLRAQALKLELWRVTLLVTGAIANIDKRAAATTIRQQLTTTPTDWQQHLLKTQTYSREPRASRQPNERHSTRSSENSKAQPQ